MKAAKKEGQVTIYTGGYERVFAEFQYKKSRSLAPIKDPFLLPIEMTNR